MSIVPDTRIGKIEFYEAHVPAWRANAAAIGLTEEQVALLEADTADARADFHGQKQAQNAARAATVAFHHSTARMHERGAALLRTIKNLAETSGDPGVYALARIPPPAAPGPTATPGTPFALHVDLLATGALVLSWKCPNPSGTCGTMYEVQRQIGDAAPFAYVGATGSKTFIDDTLPAGSGSVTYQITAIRSTARGLPARFPVCLGVGEGVRAVRRATPGVADEALWNVPIPAPRAASARIQPSG